MKGTVIIRAALLIAAAAMLTNAQDNPGTWSKIASLPRARQEMPGCHLDGKIYVAGGMNDGKTCCNALNWFEVYDISQDKWTELPNLPYAANHVGMVGLNGKVYVMGGWLTGYGGTAQKRMEVFDVAAKTWSHGPDMPKASAGPGVVVYKGKIYVFGGSEDGAFDKSGHRNVQEYNPATNSWKIVNSSAPQGKCHVGAGLIGDKVYICPGRPDKNGNRMNDRSVQEFDFMKMDQGAAAWRQMNPLQEPSKALTGYMSNWPAVNGKLYYIGGEDGGWSAHKECYEFAPDANGGSWRRINDYPTSIHGIGPVTVGNKIYVMGGAAGGGINNKTTNCYVYTIKGGAVAARKPQRTMSAALIGNSAADIEIVDIRGAVVARLKNRKLSTISNRLGAGSYYARLRTSKGIEIIRLAKVR